MATHAILQTFYASKAWRLLRLTLISEREGRCQRCKAITESKDIVGHHIIELTPENVHDHTISLNPENIEIICRTCHDEEHNRFGRQKVKAVYLIYGPPLAGKEEYVQQQLRRGDLVIDMDALYAAVSGLEDYDKPDSLFPNVIALHNLLMDQVKTRMGRWQNAWIIGGYADKFKRERIANDVGAEMIFLEATKEDCFARLEEDERLRFRKSEWRGYIEKWFDQYKG